MYVTLIVSILNFDDFTAHVNTDSTELCQKIEVKKENKTNTIKNPNLESWDFLFIDYA